MSCCGSESPGPNPDTDLQPCLCAGLVELWTFASQFQDALELQTVPSIAEMEQAFANPDQPKNSTIAVLVSPLIASQSDTPLRTRSERCGTKMAGLVPVADQRPPSSL